MVTNSIANAKSFRFSEKERLLILEIGYGTIESASAFVNYIAEEYGMPQSSCWYSLKKLKAVGLLSFPSKDSNDAKGLFLTENGKYVLRESYKVSIKSRLMLEDKEVTPLIG